MSWFKAGHKESGDTKDRIVTFEQAKTRENIISGEKHFVIFGKIAKYFADLKNVAFTGSYNDLSNKPTTIDNSNTAKTAAKLATPRTINGTSFDGSANITTSKWGESRKLTLCDKEEKGVSNVSIDGSVDIKLKLPPVLYGNQMVNWIQAFYKNGGMIGSEYLNYVRIWSNYFRSGVSDGADGSGWHGNPEVRFISGIMYDAQAVTGNSYLRPNLDNDTYLGSGDKRWKQVYAVNGTISTSDRREKCDISYIGQKSDYDTCMTDGQLIEFIMGLLPVIFRRKNGESGRPHHGIISQDFEELLKKIGLSDHAAFIKSPKTKNIEIEKEIEKEVTKEDGTIEIVKEMAKEVQQEEIPGEYIYGIRYEELISDTIRFCQILYNKNEELEKTVNKKQEEMEELKRCITEMEKRITVLESKNS